MTSALGSTFGACAGDNANASACQTFQIRIDPALSIQTSSPTPSTSAPAGRTPSTDTPTPAPLAGVPASIRISPNSAAVVYGGESIQFTAVVLDKAGDPISGVAVSWDYDRDPFLVDLFGCGAPPNECGTLSSSGLFTAKRYSSDAGIQTLKVSWGDLSGRVFVTIKAPRTGDMSDVISQIEQQWAAQSGKQLTSVSCTPSNNAPLPGQASCNYADSAGGSGTISITFAADGSFSWQSTATPAGPYCGREFVSVYVNSSIYGQAAISVDGRFIGYNNVTIGVYAPGNHVVYIQYANGRSATYNGYVAECKSYQVRLT